jgi:3-hydroxybutyryl-CoA dehydrogenase
MQERLKRALEAGKLKPEQGEAILENLSFSADLDDLKGCGFVLESIVEDRASKEALFRKLDERLPPEAILATNTSGLSVTGLSGALGPERRRRFLGCHFFNPPFVLRLVEVVPTWHTEPQVVEAVRDLLERVGKRPIVVRDSRGFIVNRLLVPYLLDAVRLLERGVAGIEDMDVALREGAAMPMGPLELIDYIGVDVVHAIAQSLFEEYRKESFSPPELLSRMLQLGLLGRKSGCGFYDYRLSPPVPQEELVRGFRKT